MKQEEARRLKAEQEREAEEARKKLNWLNVTTSALSQVIFGNIELERMGEHFNRSITKRRNK
nr:MAG TPA: hypothetical protein [Caudoviricetes sp.]